MVHDRAPKSLPGALSRLSGDGDRTIPTERLAAFRAGFEQSNARLGRDDFPGAADMLPVPPAERRGRAQESVGADGSCAAPKGWRLAPPDAGGVPRLSRR